MAEASLTYLHPSIVSNINSTESVYQVADGVTTLFTADTFEKGVDNKIKLVTSVDEFIANYGEPNYTKYGQAAYNVINWLENGGQAFILRALPDNAQLAHAILNVQTKVNNSSKKILDSDGKITTIDDVFIRPVTAYITKNNTDLTMIKSELMLDRTNTSSYQTVDGYYNNFILAVYPLGRGSAYNNYGFRMSLNKSFDNDVDSRIYNFEVIEYDKLTGNSSVVEGPFYVSFDEDALSSSNESMFIEDVINHYSNLVRVTFNKDAYLKVANKINPNINPNKIDILTGQSIINYQGESETFYSEVAKRQLDTHVTLHKYGSDGKVVTSNGEVVLNIPDYDDLVEGSLISLDNSIRENASKRFTDKLNKMQDYFTKLGTSEIDTSISKLYSYNRDAHPTGNSSDAFVYPTGQIINAIKRLQHKQNDSDYDTLYDIFKNALNAYKENPSDETYAGVYNAASSLIVGYNEFLDYCNDINAIHYMICRSDEINFRIDQESLINNNNNMTKTNIICLLHKQNILDISNEILKLSLGTYEGNILDELSYIASLINDEMEYFYDNVIPSCYGDYVNAKVQMGADEYDKVDLGKDLVNDEDRLKKTKTNLFIKTLKLFNDHPNTPRILYQDLSNIIEEYNDIEETKQNFINNKRNLIVAKIGEILNKPSNEYITYIIDEDNNIIAKSVELPNALSSSSVKLFQFSNEEMYNKYKPGSFNGDTFTPTGGKNPDTGATVNGNSADYTTLFTIDDILYSPYTSKILIQQYHVLDSEGNETSEVLIDYSKQKLFENEDFDPICYKVRVADIEGTNNGMYGYIYDYVGNTTTNIYEPRIIADNVIFEHGYEEAYNINPNGTITKKEYIFLDENNHALNINESTGQIITVNELKSMDADDTNNFSNKFEEILFEAYYKTNVETTLYSTYLINDVMDVVSDVVTNKNNPSNYIPLTFENKSDAIAYNSEYAAYVLKLIKENKYTLLSAYTGIIETINEMKDGYNISYHEFEDVDSDLSDLYNSVTKDDYTIPEIYNRFNYMLDVLITAINDAAVYKYQDTVFKNSKKFGGFNTETGVFSGMLSYIDTAVNNDIITTKHNSTVSDLKEIAKQQIDLAKADITKTNSMLYNNALQNFAYPIKFSMGSDGDFEYGLNNVKARNKFIKNILIKAYKGQIDTDITNRRLIEIDHILDANYDDDIKNAIVTLVRDIRGDCFFWADTGIQPSPEDVLDWRRNKFNVFSRNVGIFSQDLTFYDEYIGKDIKFTTPYVLAKKIPFNAREYGLQYPIAGPRRGLIDGFKAISWTPNEAYKEQLYTNKVNYVEQDVRRTKLGSQLTTDSKNGPLSDINNMLTILKLKRNVEKIVEDYQFEFNDTETQSQLYAELNDYCAGYISNRSCESISISVYASDYDKQQKILRVSLSIKFNNVIERIVISLDVQK